MSDYITDIWNKCCTWFGDITSSTIGNGIVTIGVSFEEIAGAIMIIGVFLWICRNTKVFRIGLVSYLIGLLIELIGSSMIK